MNSSSAPNSSLCDGALTSILDGVPVPILVLKTYRILYANQAALSLTDGDSKTGLAGWDIRDIVHPDDHAAFDEKSIPIRCMPTTIGLRSSNGEIRECQISLRKIQISDETVGIVMFENPLAGHSGGGTLTHEQLKSLISLADHDLKQHLNSINLYAGLLEAKFDSPAIRPIVEGIRQASDSFSALLGSLVELVQLEAGIAVVEARRVMIADLMSDALAWIAANNEERIRVAVSSVEVETDPVLCGRLLYIMVCHAVQRSSNGKIVVGVRSPRNSPRLEIWASGPGLSSEERAAFDNSKRPGSAAGNGRGRMGVNLAIARRMAALIRCDLAAETFPSGVRFTICLPGT